MSTFQRTFAVGAIALGGCGAADESHPASAAQSSSSETSLSVDYADNCVPDSIRECRHYYKDENGQLQCPLGVQQCNPYGAGWSECGSSVPRPDAGTVLGSLE